MKRLLPVAAVLLAAVPWVFAVTQRPGAAHPERAGVTPPAAASATPVPDHEPASPEAAESTDRFKTGCGWCDPQVSELGGTCVAFCAENSGGVSCAAAGEGEGAVETLMSREQKHRSPIENIREVWVRVSGSGTRVSDLARHLRSLSGWTVDVPSAIEPLVVREGDLHAFWSGLSSQSLALADGRKLRILGDGGRHLLELRAEGSTG
jgi:hypothetical protein